MSSLSKSLMDFEVNIDGEILPHCSLPIIKYSSRERIHRGLKTFFIFFFAGILSIFIPVLHFILVPTLLISSIFLALKKYSEDLQIDLSQYKCPSCGNHFSKSSLSTKSTTEHIRWRCFHCQKNITLKSVTS